MQSNELGCDKSIVNIKVSELRKAKDLSALLHISTILSLGTRWI
jgi:hypothetical protein